MEVPLHSVAMFRCPNKPRDHCSLLDFLVGSPYSHTFCGYRKTGPLGKPPVSFIYSFSSGLLLPLKLQNPLIYGPSLSMRHPFSRGSISLPPQRRIWLDWIQVDPMKAIHTASFSHHVFLSRNSNRFPWFQMQISDPKACLNGICQFCHPFPSCLYSERKHRLYLNQSDATLMTAVVGQLLFDITSE